MSLQQKFAARRRQTAKMLVEIAEVTKGLTS
jgi:hypothetical protein